MTEEKLAHVWVGGYKKLKNDPAFGPWVRRIGSIQLPVSDVTPFFYLVRAICHQQLAGKAAHTIHGRFIEAVGREDWFELPKDEKLEKTKAMGIDVDPALEDFEITNDVFEKVIEHTLVQPTFVTHIPKELCPLAKITQDDESTIDVFELCINGQEIAPAYSEQNDPAVQREAFMKQVGEETQELDDDFLLALEHGMPPAGGMGLGIDRLVIFLTKAANIRDTILFPTLRPS